MDGSQLELIYAKRQKLFASSAYKRFKDLEDIRLIFSIYKMNYASFKKTLRNYYKKVPIMDFSQRRRFGQKLVVREIHNLLFSSRVYIEKYNKTKGVDDEFHSFIKELRNYITHQNFFPLSSIDSMSSKGKFRYETMSYSEFEDYLCFMIQKSPKKIGLQNAKSFLETKKHDFNLNLIFEEYHLKLNDEYNEAILEIVRINKVDLNNLIHEAKIINIELVKQNAPNLIILSKIEIRYLKYLIKKQVEAK